MLAVSGINVNSKTNQKSITTNPNYLAKLPSQTNTDTISFGTKGIIPERVIKPFSKELEQFIKKHPDVFGDFGQIYFKQENLGWKSMNLEFPKTDELETQYNKKMHDGQLRIISGASPEKFKDFIIQLLEHKKEYPFEVTSYFDEIGIRPRNKELVGASTSHCQHSSDLSNNRLLYKFLQEDKKINEYRSFIEFDGKLYSIELERDGFSSQNVNGIRAIPVNQL